MFGNYFKHVLILTLLAGLTYSLPQVKDAMAGAFYVGYTTDASTLTAAAGDLARSVVSSGPVKVKEIRAKVVYEAKHKETGVAITAKVQIDGGVSGVAIPESKSFSVTLRNKTLNTDGAYSALSVDSSNLTKDSTGTYNVKAGTTALFNVSGQVSTGSMIAGQYEVFIVSVLTTEGKLPAPNNKSNTIVVIGEASPYITLVSQGFYGTQDTLILNTVRLGKNPTISFQSMYGICPAGYTCPAGGTVKTYSLRGNQNSKQVKFSLADNNITPGSYGIFVTNTELGSVAGKSNYQNIQVLDQNKILTAKVIPGKLALTYDANQQEASLGAQFEITIKAGNESLSIDSGSFAVSGASNVVLKSVNGLINTIPTYTLPAGKEARFLISATNNPKIMFAGQYAMSVLGVYPMTSSGNKVYVQVNKNETNTVTIVGETSPYINSVTNPATVGQQFQIAGQRLAGSNIFIDGAVVANTVITGSVDGTSLSFTLPSTIQDGFHLIYVKNDATGQSNTMWFESMGAIVIDPNTCYTFTTNLQVGSTGVDVAYLQAFLSSHGFQGTGSFQQGLFDESTKAAVMAYQTSLGQPATGFVGPITRATLNATCTQNNGQVVANIDSASPLDRTVQISDSAITSNVVLAVFDVKAKDATSTLQSLKLNMDAYGNWSGNQPDTLFTNIKIRAGGITYNKTSSSPTPVGENGVKLNFDNLNIPLPTGINIPITVIADVAINSNNSLASSSAKVYLYPNQTNINAVGMNNIPVAVADSGVLTSATTFFSANSSVASPYVMNASAILGAAITANNTVIAYPVQFNFSVVAAETIYIGKAGAITLSTNSTSTPVINYLTASAPSSIAGDSVDSYIIPAGTSRAFTTDTSLASLGTAGLKTVQITAIRYGTSPSNLSALSITQNLENLKATAIFP